MDDAVLVLSGPALTSDAPAEINLLLQKDQPDERQQKASAESVSRKRQQKASAERP